MNFSDFFQHKKVAVAFSGGVDSAFLLYLAKKYAMSVTAYYVKTQFQPSFELEDAKRLASELSAELKIIELDILSDDEISKNPENRCYFCKRKLFSAILKSAEEDGYTTVLDGTNASDLASDRPGMKALEELCVYSPLKEFGLKKDKIRELSKEAGLFTFDKAAYACLATRVKTGERITTEKLCRIEKTEDFLFSLGFSDFRVRETENTAKIQVKENQFDLLFKNKNEIVKYFKDYYENITLDLEGR